MISKFSSLLGIVSVQTSIPSNKYQTVNLYSRVIEIVQESLIHLSE